VDFSALFQALATNPFPAFLTLALLAIAWLVRDSRARDAEHAKALQAANDDRAEKLEAAHAAHLETAMQVAPLASKLVTCVEVLERLSARVGGG
jgi:hypothetical protein